LTGFAVVIGWLLVGAGSGRAIHRWLSGGADPEASCKSGGRVYDVKADSDRCKRA
jgi:hypothetical protein